MTGASGMHTQNTFLTHLATVFFEVFPPRTSEAAEPRYHSITRREMLKPSFVSLTYGGG